MARTSALRKHADALAEFQTSIATCRDKIAALKEELAALDTRPCPRATAERRIDEWLDRQIGDNALQFGRLLEHDDRLSGGPDAAPGTLAFDLLILAAVRDQVKAVITQRLATYFQTYPGISPDQLAAERARLDAEILALELAEESMIRTAENTGMLVQRRGDLDPRAALASDASLPAC